MLRKRILEGFTAIAENLERSGGGNAIVVSHGMTIATFAWLIDSSVEHPSLDNGSVTVVAYENGKFDIRSTWRYDLSSGWARDNRKRKW